jgi:hypothetical protein
MRRSLREYLGAKVSVKSAASKAALRVRVELPDFQARATTSSDWRATWRRGHGRARLSASSRRR